MARDPEIAFRCTGCQREAVCGLDGRGRCRCGAEPALALSPSIREERIIDRCPACEGVQLYVQRDFNQRAGLAIVVVGALAAPFTPYYSSLYLAALIDTALFLVLPTITICYRCHAHFRGFVRNPKHEGFDLHLAEQYEKKT